MVELVIKYYVPLLVQVCMEKRFSFFFFDVMRLQSQYIV